MGTKVYHPTKKVLKVTQPVLPLLMNRWNAKNTAVQIPFEDPDGNFIVGANFLTDPDFTDFLNSLQGNQLKQGLTEIPYCYLDVTE